VNAARPAYPHDRFHVGAALKEPHAKWQRAQLEKVFERGGDIGERWRHGS